MNGAKAVASVLKAEGVEYLFCFPNSAIIDSAADLGIKPIMARTERTAIGMADGYTRVTSGRKIGVCTAQYQPGVENSFGGVAQAFSDSTPILFMPGGVPQNRLWSEPNFDAVLNYQHITKWVARINSVGRVSELMRRAFTYLRTGRPGPVVLELPGDVTSAQLDDDAFAYKPVKSAKPMANPADVRDAVKALLAAKKPVIQAGMGVLYAEAWDELLEFAELVQVPVTTPLPGKSCFPEDHPLSLGSGGMSGPKAVAHYLAASDLIFGVGASFSISSFAAPIPRGKVAVQVTIDERDLNKDYAVDYPIVGDAKLVLQQLIEEVKRQLGPDGRRGDDSAATEVAAVRHAWLSEWMSRLTSDEVPINPYRVMWDLQQALDMRNVIATHDAGNPRDQMSPFWRAITPNSYIGWGKSTHLGYSLPLALGAKLAEPSKTVVHVMGDAAFGMSGMDVETAVRNNIGTLTIIMNNSCLGGYEKYMPIATNKYGTRFLSGNYTKVAEALGAYAERVETPDEIVPAVKRALGVTRDARPAVLEIITKEEPQLSKYW